MAELKAPAITMQWNTRFCSVKGKFGYFHTWEHFSKPLPASPLVDGEPAGVFSRVFGIVEFKDGVQRVEPVDIIFHDEDSKSLELMEEYENERRKNGIQ